MACPTKGCRGRRSRAKNVLLFTSVPLQAAVADQSLCCLVLLFARHNVQQFFSLLKCGKPSTLHT
eukprot:9384564-Lingulodinium_polyedra.AAC.2